VTERKVAHRRRLDVGLYVCEGVIALGAAVFLIGFWVEKSSNTPGRVIEVAGTVIFATGLLTAAAYGYMLSQFFARSTADPFVQHTNDGPRPNFSYLGSRMHPAVGDPTAGLVGEVRANPENDIARARLIERERQGIESTE
jgi:hypothetical protein